MSDLIRAQPSPLGLGSGPPGESATAAPPAPATQPMSAGALGPMAQAGQVLADLQAALLRMGAGPTGAPAAGAPRLDAPALDNLSTDDLALLIGNLQSKTSEAQIKTAMNGLDTAKMKKDQQNERVLAQIKESAEKAKNAGVLEKVMPWLSAVGKAFGVGAAALSVAINTVLLVLAIAGAVATVGVGTGAVVLAAAMLTGSAIGFAYASADAVISVASAISISAGGPNLDPMHWIMKGVDKALEGMGADEKTRMGLTIALQIGVTVAVAVAGIAVNIVGAVASMGVSAGAAAVDTGVKAAQSAVKITAAIIGGAVQIASGLVQMGTGAASMASTAVRYEADVSQAKVFDFKAVLQKIQKQMEQDQEDLKKIVTELQDSLTSLTSMLNQASQLKTQQLRNMI